MKNQEWRERLANKFGNFGLYGKGDFGTHVDQFEAVQEFLESELQAERERVKKAVLDGLPKEITREQCSYSDPVQITIAIQARTQALSEVKQLIENL